MPSRALAVQAASREEAGEPVSKVYENLSAIVAVCDNWGIGLGGDMVVSNRMDMRHFVGGRPLKDRRNIVLTRDASFARQGVEVVHSVEEALAALAPDEEAWVVGGAEVYRQLLPFCACAEVTKNHEVRPADTFFPDLDADPAWRVTAVDGPHTVLPGEGDEGLVYEFVTYRHQKPQDR